MRSTLILIFSIVLVFSSCKTKKQTTPQTHTSYNSLDWKGIYRGVLPCADCAGIQTEIKLYPDNTYLLSRSYLGKSIELLNDTGQIKWIKNGTAIQLISSSDSKAQMKFMLTENALISMDKDDKSLAGTTNKLTKESSSANLLNTHWKLISLLGNKLKEDTTSRIKPYLMLYENGSKANGYGGCNYFNGNFEKAEANKLFFSKMMNTLRACKHMQTELDFIGIFNQVSTYKIISDNLYFYNRDRIQLAQFKAEYLIK